MGHDGSGIRAADELEALLRAELESLKEEKTSED